MMMKLLILLLLTTLSFAAEKKLVFIGDSLTEGYGVSKEESYPQLVYQRLLKDFPNLKMVNASISGSTSASGQSRLKWQLKSKPDVVVIALGANDGLRGISTGATRTNLEKMLEICKENSVEVLLIGMKMPPNYAKEYTYQFEKVFFDLAKKWNVAFMPFLLEGVAGNPSLNIVDGVHPNSRGHQIMAKNVYPYIKEILK